MDHWVNSQKDSLKNDNVTVIQNELEKIERMKAKRLPQVICIGVQKCGSGTRLFVLSAENGGVNL